MDADNNLVKAKGGGVGVGGNGQRGENGGGGGGVGEDRTPAISTLKKFLIKNNKGNRKRGSVLKLNLRGQHLCQTLKTL